MTRGPAPKPNAERRNAHEHAAVVPRRLRPGRELPRGLGITTAGARRFWKVWSTAPQTQTWAETDWAELEITTKLVDELFRGELKFAAEIRMRTAKWGATTEDRARLRMTFEDQDEAVTQQTAVVASTTDIDEELYRLLNE
jgi:hypothetical protein